jgi:hypothetical protein
MSLAAAVALDVFLVRLYFLRTKRRTIETSISFGEAVYQLKWEFLAEFIICNLQPIPVSSLINQFGTHHVSVCLVQSIVLKDSFHGCRGQELQWAVIRVMTLVCDVH